ncbi:MAG: Ig-like domain-containing protein [Prevotellaceae bacterium]|jgi:hypothetical protein|nr:Ig-like domain-containing protein [Prevotellaceae bacterium]
MKTCTLEINRTNVGNLSLPTCICAAALWLLSGCSELSKDYHYEKYIYVPNSSLTMYVGEEFQLSANPAGETFSWSSENSAVATVDATGKVKAAGIGETYIVVSQNGAETKVTVRVITPVIDNIVVRPGDRNARFEIEINTDKVKSLKITRTDTNGSLSVDINLQRGKFSFVYPDLPEDNIRFSLVCSDAFGNESEPVYATVSVYNRDTYADRLAQRQIRIATKLGNGLSIAWANEEGSYCELYYTDLNGAQITKIVDVRQTPVLLTDFKSSLSYSTVYVVEFDEATVDTFRLAAVSPTLNDRSHIISAAAPCEIKAWDFDFGGEGVGYHDDGNKDGGSSYREYIGDPDGAGKVDIDGNTENPDNIGWTDNGEWTAYTVEVIDAGDYTVDLNVSINRDGGTGYLFEIDGVAGDTFHLDNDGSWESFDLWYYTGKHADQQPPVLSLTAGAHIIKFRHEGGFNFRAIKLTKT